ncbi:putative toxin-antitoxin system antitoxin component, TIGR02293 family [Galbibacter orientalis DSM 19592]|uniref:Putative toxin-antitoxin system antitoxin component, TIGR02293 family n=1 Tax=Galbibacter orientalis DSM 19592 TaxID=926559 RepID=I3C0Q7_9FLAO|nr:antitoxin Xre/MbcA/ParS toxin-binding domain-containing protein [Galbibacter orientalis]EIJ37200.1 putative toxin-antitoxin system antitoxin component, TIGR02293 family [Galbibacter orientalis DSM 19592]
MITEEQKKSNIELTAVNKAIKVYVRKIEKSNDVQVRTDNITYSDFFDNKMLIIKAIRKGMPYELFSKIKDITPFSEDDWAEYLNLSKKTLQRHRNDADYLFKPIHTEKIIELAEVTNFGKEVFDSSEQFYLWLNTPSFALGNLKPAELLKDSYGKELVMAELNRIDHGIFV